MGEWQRLLLGDFAPLSYGKSLPEPSRVAGKVQVYGSNGVVGAHSQYLVQDPMVVIGRKGSIGEVHYAPSGGWPIDTTFYVTGGLARDVRFSYYLLKYLDMRHMSSDSAVPGLNRGAAHALEVLIPPPPEQRAIAEVLGALDDKIEANRNVVAHSAQLAASFFEEMLQQAVATRSGVEVQLRDIAAINLRWVKPSSGSLRYLDIASVGDGMAEQASSMDWSEAPSRARRGVADGDTLWSTVRPNRRSHYLVLDPPKDLVVSTGFAVLTPIKVRPSLLYAITDRPEFSDFLTSSADGSAYPAVGAERILDAPILLPPSDAQNAFEESTMPLRRLAHAVTRQSGILSQLRDALLPKLLSGELRVRDAESLVEEVV